MYSISKKEVKINIHGRYVGKGKPVFIIAEAGVNHNGSADIAKRIIDSAVESGADAVKFQTFKAEEVVIKNTPITEYQKKNISREVSQQKMLETLELKYADFIELKEYCDKKNVIFLSTPHSEDAIDFLDPLVPAYKIGSGDLNNLPLLEKAAKKGKPIILSSGMSTLREVKEAVGCIKNKKNNRIILLHCTTNYPCPPAEVNLNAMLTLKDNFGLPIGYSDHTEGIAISVAAVAMGACIIEKHLTLDKGLPGPDHKASLEPDEFKEMIHAIRAIEKALGSSIKRPTKNELKIKRIARKSIVARVDINEGEKINKKMLIIKRPGTGIKPRYLTRLVGKRARIGIKKDTLLKLQDLI